LSISSCTVFGHTGAGLVTVIFLLEVSMIHCPVRVVSKLIVVCATDKEYRYCVVVYVNGKVDSSHLPMSIEEANTLADSIINGDRC